jgi:hypothetical protein
LLRSHGPGPLDELNDIAYDVIEARYMLGGLTKLQHDSLRRMIAVDVTIAMAALHVLGVVVLDREAGSVMLTDLGRYAVRRVRGMAQPGDPSRRCSPPTPRYSSCGSRSPAWTARRCGDKW